MANWSDPRATLSPGVAAETAATDTGLRRYMLSVYNYMTSGVLLTGIVALLMFSTGAVSAMVGPRGGLSGLGWVVALAPFGLVLWLSFGINRMSEGTAKALFWLYAAVTGAGLSTLLLAYTGSSIAQTFFATAAAFAGLSLYGYTTKRDLGPIGTFLIMGVVGLLVAMLINMFVQSQGMDLIISFVGVLLFAGLTAYDTQKIKSMYFQVAGTSFAGKSVVMGALTLYLDFLNMFLFLLRFLGDRR